VELDEVADELYAVPPEEFIDLRKARQDEAKADGDKALAKEINSLPKPSTAAWVCNLLVREAHDEIAGLVELGTLVREAQESLAGEQLRALDIQRRQLVTALTRQARKLAYEHGHTVSTAVATQVEETLRAAMADPDAGEALLSGRLTSPLNYSGMGLGEQRPHLRVVPPPRATTRPDSEKVPPKRPADRSGSPDERRRRKEEEARQAAEEKRRRELAEARQAAEDAEAAAEEAAEVAEVERAKAEELAAREDELTTRIEFLTRELARVREECSTVGTDRARVERRRKAADHRRREADTALEHARARVEQLSRS
jgi:hypothetical protein